MATDYNQISSDLYEKYRAANNVGISYTGLIYNLDVGYGTTNLYDPVKNRFIELSPNYQNKNFTFSTPGSGLLATNGIGTVSIAFTGGGTDYATNDITATIPGIGTDTPSKLTVEMWAKINNFSGHYGGNPNSNAGGMLFSFDCYDVWTGDNDINGTLGFNAFDAKTRGLTKEKVQSLMLQGNWHHYVFVMTPYVSNEDINVKNKIYIDSYDQGSLINNRGTGGSQNNRGFAGGRFKINGNSCGGFSPNYKLDMDVGAVRIYNRELTSEEVIENYNTTKGRYFTQQIVSDGLALNLDATNASSVGVGTTWTDLSGNGNNGTLVNGPYHSDGPFLDAGFVSFDGTDDYISIGSTTDFAFGTGDFTVEAWVRRNGDQVGNATIACVPQSAADTNWQFNLNASNKVVYKIGGGGGDVISSSTVPDKTWTHVSVTRSGTTLRLFIDGVEEDSATSSEDLSDDDGIRIGRNRADNAPVYFKGEISNLRLIKGTALYTSNFTPPTRLLTAVDNTVLLTCQKETIRDGSIDIHTVTANNGAAANLGFPSSSYEFDGVDDYITLDENSDLANITGDISIEAWFNIDTTNNGNRAIWSKGRTPDPGGGSQTHSLLWVSSSNTIGGLIGNLDGTASSVGQTIITAGQWYHVVLTSDGSNNRIYINGVLDDTNARTSAEIYNTNQNGGVSIGRDVRYPTTSNRMWDGEIGEVRVYPRALTAAEVLQNYNATKGRYGI